MVEILGADFDWDVGMPRLVPTAPLTPDVAFKHDDPNVGVLGDADSWVQPALAVAATRFKVFREMTVSKARVYLRGGLTQNAKYKMAIYSQPPYESEFLEYGTPDWYREGYPFGLVKETNIVEWTYNPESGWFEFTFGYYTDGDFNPSPVTLKADGTITVGGWDCPAGEYWLTVLVQDDHYRGRQGGGILYTGRDVDDVGRSCKVWSWAVMSFLSLLFPFPTADAELLATRFAMVLDGLDFDCLLWIEETEAELGTPTAPIFWDEGFEWPMSFDDSPSSEAVSGSGGSAQEELSAVVFWDQSFIWWLPPEGMEMGPYAPRLASATISALTGIRFEAGIWDVEHSTPGRKGSHLQALGVRLRRIRLYGWFHGGSGAWEISALKALQERGLPFTLKIPEDGSWFDGQVKIEGLEAVDLEPGRPLPLGGEKVRYVVAVKEVP